MSKSTITNEEKLQIAVKIKKAKVMLPTDEELATLAGVNRMALHREVNKEEK